MPTLLFTTDAFDPEGNGEDLMRALADAFASLGLATGPIELEDHGCTMSLDVEGAAFLLTACCVEPEMEEQATGSTGPDVADDDAVDPEDELEWRPPRGAGSLETEVRDPRTLWQRIRGVPRPPLPTAGPRGPEILRTAVETLEDADEIEWDGEPPPGPTSF